MPRCPQPPPVYALADVDTLGEEATPGVVEELAEAGVGWIQIRAKSTPDDRLYSLIQECFDALDSAGVAADLWLNDRPDLAALFPFAGVHLGQRDLAPVDARRVVGEATWIGASCHDDEELARALEDSAVDVVAVGPVFATSGKADPEPVVGLGFVERARRAADDAGKPLVAIGGIDAERLPRVLESGAHGAAVLGAVCGASVPGNAARRLLRIAAASTVTVGGAP